MIEDFSITKNFKLSEFVNSEKAEELEIDNTPSSKEIGNIIVLVKTVLQPLRNAISYPFYINSGFRCKKLNEAVGGSATSAHLLGLAADVTLGSKQLNKILYKELTNGKYDFDQAINEYNYSWIHIGIKKDRSKNRQLVFKIG